LAVDRGELAGDIDAERVDQCDDGERDGRSDQTNSMAVAPDSFARNFRKIRFKAASFQTERENPPKRNYAYLNPKVV